MLGVIEGELAPGWMGSLGLAKDKVNPVFFRILSSVSMSSDLGCDDGGLVIAGDTGSCNLLGCGGRGGGGRGGAGFLNID